jgi:hypothetical protein
MSITDRRGPPPIVVAILLIAGVLLLLRLFPFCWIEAKLCELGLLENRIEILGCEGHPCSE